MSDPLSLDDLVWRREPVGPDLDYDEIAVLLDEVVRLQLLLSGYGKDFRLLVEPTEPRTAMWEESLTDARQRWEDAIHRRFYYRGKPTEDLTVPSVTSYLEVCGDLVDYAKHREHAVYAVYVLHPHSLTH